MRKELDESDSGDEGAISNTILRRPGVTWLGAFTRVYDRTSFCGGSDQEFEKEEQAQRWKMENDWMGTTKLRSRKINWIPSSNSNLSNT